MGRHSNNKRDQARRRKHNARILEKTNERADIDTLLRLSPSLSQPSSLLSYFCLLMVCSASMIEAKQRIDGNNGDEDRGAAIIPKNSASQLPAMQHVAFIPPPPLQCKMQMNPPRAALFELKKTLDKHSVHENDSYIRQNYPRAAAIKRLFEQDKFDGAYQLIINEIIYETQQGQLSLFKYNDFLVSQVAELVGDLLTARVYSYFHQIAQELPQKLSSYNDIEKFSQCQRALRQLRNIYQSLLKYHKGIGLFGGYGALSVAEHGLKQQGLSPSEQFEPVITLLTEEIKRAKADSSRVTAYVGTVVNDWADFCGFWSRQLYHVEPRIQDRSSALEIQQTDEPVTEIPPAESNVTLVTTSRMAPS